MKTVTTREVQQKLGRVLSRVRSGEKITITKRGEAVARLVPVGAKHGKKIAWPDFSGRMKRRFPGGPPQGKPTSSVVLELREERL